MTRTVNGSNPSVGMMSVLTNSELRYGKYVRSFQSLSRDDERSDSTSPSSSASCALFQSLSRDDERSDDAGK